MSIPATASSPDRYVSSPVTGHCAEGRLHRLVQARIRVEGLGSAFDAARLERRLDRVVGVLGVHVNPITDHAAVAYDPSLTSPSMIVKQIEFSGFRATVR